MKHKAVKVSSYYEIKDGKVIRKRKICPKCGSFMAEHKDRWYCGKCHYTEFKSAK